MIFAQSHAKIKKLNIFIAMIMLILYYFPVGADADANAERVEWEQKLSSAISEGKGIYESPLSNCILKTLRFLIAVAFACIKITYVKLLYSIIFLSSSELDGRHTHN